jgi:uncharacterized membrane protein YqhA
MQEADNADGTGEYVKKKKFDFTVENIFEFGLWQFRWAVVIGVVASTLTALMMFYVAAVDTVYVVRDYIGYVELDSADARNIFRADAISHVVEIIDGFLLAIVLLIFAYGIYELYISRIELAKGNEAEAHFLRIESLDSLKARVGKVILMILIVKFFEVSLAMDYDSVKEIMLFAIAIALISVSFFLAETAARKGRTLHTRREDFEQQRRRLLADDASE